MREALDNPFVQFLVMLFAVIAGLLAVKTLAARLPNGGITGAVKTALLAA